MKNMNMGVVIALYVIVSLFFSATAHAQGNGKVDCQRAAELAHYIMMQRQTTNNMPMLMKHYKNDKNIQLLVRAAFEENYYFTQDMKQYEVKSFTNLVYQRCLRLPEDERTP